MVPWTHKGRNSFPVNPNRDESWPLNEELNINNVSFTTLINKVDLLNKYTIYDMVYILK